MSDQLCISADSQVVESSEFFGPLAGMFGEKTSRVVIDDPPKGPQLSLGDDRLGFTIAGFFQQNVDFTSPEARALLVKGYELARLGCYDVAEWLKDPDLGGLEAEVIYPSVTFNVYQVEDLELHLLFTTTGPQTTANSHQLDCSRWQAFSSMTWMKRSRRWSGQRLRATWPVHPGQRGHPTADTPTPGTTVLGSGSGYVYVLGHAYLHWRNCQPRHALRSGHQRTFIHHRRCVHRCDNLQSGVCDRFPKIKFVMTEFEAGWIGITLKRFDWAYIRGGGERMFGLPMNPSEY